ncbi:MAG TPA: hypothetical protein VFH48_14875 [Chloroflexota bacterium]|nr:hypothetical protein [Chloroflexota bacterium]
MTDESPGDRAMGAESSGTGPAGTDPSGEMLALVIRFGPDRHGQWSVSVDGTTTLPARPVPPTTLIVRLWRSGERGVLRGTLRLGDDEAILAPIQTNDRLEALVRAWLGEPGAPAPVRSGAEP